MNEQSQIQTLKKRNRNLSFGLGGVGLLFVILCLLMYMGPVVGNEFRTINKSLIGFDGGGAYPAATEAPALEIDAAYDVARALQIEPSERLIIRNGTLRLTVEDTRAAQKEVEKVVAELAAKGAFLVSSNERTNYEGQDPYIDTTIRVPAEEFDAVMNRIAKLAVKVDERSESADDVTAEFVDLNTRLESLEAARDRLLEIMKQSATTEELLLAEQQLTQRETEIESIKGRMKFLSESARLSSITISLYPYLPSQPLDDTWRPAETFRGAVDALVNSLRGFADFMIVFVIAVAPWLVALGLIWWGVARVVRKRRERKTG
ncbi:MAG: DUF4349 domain-containing protein [Chloroflexi bacterium]|nr:DUF4349 domain-containing protein [Chloroflexota bacterium]